MQFFYNILTFRYERWKQKKNALFAIPTFRALQPFIIIIGYGF